MSFARRGLQVDDPLAAGGPLRSTGEHGATGTSGRLKEIRLDAIRANPDQPRRRFDEEKLLALAASIRERGVLQPVIVRPIEEGFELVAGERRCRAARQAGLQSIPALIDAAVDEAGSLELALIENMVREDLTPIEQARTLAVLLGDLHITGEGLAQRLGRSRADIVNTVRLLDLPDEAIKLIDARRLSKGHGKALLTEPDHHRRRQLARAAVTHGWSVRALEAEIARTARPRPSRHTPDADQRAAAGHLEDTITAAIGCDVRAVPHRLGFQIILDPPAADRLARALGAEVRST